MSRSKRKPYHHGDLRRALLESARRLVETEGPEAISFRRLAEEVEVSHAAPLTHFPDRLSLDASLATMGFQELRNRCERAGFQARAAPVVAAIAEQSTRPTPAPALPTAAALAAAPARQPTPVALPRPGEHGVLGMKLVTAALIYLRFALEHPGLFRMMQEPRLSARLSESSGKESPPLQELSQEKAGAFEVFVDLVRQGHARGEFKQDLAPDRIARLVTALVEGLANQYLEAKVGAGPDPLRDAEGLLDLLIRSFSLASG